MNWAFEVTTPIRVAREDDLILELEFLPPTDVDNGCVMMCRYINHDTGEVREQCLDEMPTNRGWRQTVERRMRAWHPDVITPKAIIPRNTAL